MTWKSEWKQQLTNLNRLCLWMLVDAEVTDDQALTAATELKVFLERVERLLVAIERDEE